MRRCERFAILIIGLVEGRRRPRKNLVLRHDMTHLQLTDDITLDRRA